MGSAGIVILFVCTLTGTTIFAIFVLSYTAHCYLTVMQDTADGLDQVVWPSEPIADRLGQAGYLGFLTALWLAPAGILASALRHDVLPGQPGLLLLLIAVPGLWLCFPVGLLSSLSASSRWIPLRLAILQRLLRLFPATVGFYLSTALLLAGSAALWYVALAGSSALLLPVAGGLGAAVVLIHARLLGRLAWLVRRLGPEKSAPVRKRPPPAPARKRRPRPGRAAEVKDPWTIPKEPKGSPEEAPKLPVEGYAMAEQEQVEVPDFWSKRPRKRQHGPRKPQDVPATPPPELPVEGYEVADEGAGRPKRPGSPALTNEAPPPPREPEQARETAVKPEALARELELRERHAPGPEPTHPLLQGVYEFPWYGSSVGAWLVLTLGGTGLGVAIRALVQLFPG